MGKLLKTVGDKLNKIKAKFGKKSQLLLAGILAVIVLIIFFDGILSNDKNKELEPSSKQESVTDEDNYVSNLEMRLENILSSLSLVKSVETFIMTETSTKTIYATNETTNTDSSTAGNNSVSSSVELVFSKNGSSSTPIVSVEVYPEIVGVLVVVDAEGDEKTRLMIINAVAVALDIENSKIEVLLAS